ncbi:MAG: hypothetical protein D6722_26330 [Bacteroidetes bacterium]|nr:MAG: hypothetical protein D6722_26330 [Bacteroidota bacterium]
MTPFAQRLLIILLVVLTILLVPFTLMQWTGEVNWSVADFAVMGLLLLGAGLGLDQVLRRTQKAKTRLLWVAAVLLAFFLIWAELAVGIFGSPLAGS